MPRTSARRVRPGLLEYQRGGGGAAVLDVLGLPAWLPRLNARRTAAATAGLDGIIYAIIEAGRRQPGSADDLLGLLLAARDDETGQAMSDAELRDQVATIFTAGHETTANALLWTGDLLPLHRQARAKLHAGPAA